MAGILFDEFRKSTGGNPSNAQGQTDWQDGTIGCWFVDEGTDTIDQAADVDCADRTGFNPTFANAPNLAGKTSAVTANVLILDATDQVFTGGSVLTGVTSVESLELWVDTGTNTTSNLISNHDDYTGLPLTPSGTDVTVVWPATGIIRI
jgi:hypothetical protein